MMGFGADDFFVIRIEDDQVGVGANGDGAFARIQAKEFAGAVATSWTKRLGEKCLPWTPPV